MKNLERDEMEHLLLQKEIAYTTLKDLDFDFKTGKLSQEDFEELKFNYEKEAFTILEKIDALSRKQWEGCKKK